MTLFIFNFVAHLKYAGIFLGSFIEGPTVGLIAGFLVRLGYISFFSAYLAHVLGDFGADCLYFFAGYLGKERLLPKFYRSAKISARAERVRTAFREHPRKVIILGKLTHVFGLPILIGMGMARYSWRKFLVFNFIATLIKSAGLIFLGYYFAGLWQKINNIFSYLALLGILAVILLLIYLGIKQTKIYNKIYAKTKNTAG